MRIYTEGTILKSVCEFRLEALTFTSLSWILESSPINLPRLCHGRWFLQGPSSPTESIASPLLLSSFETAPTSILPLASPQQQRQLKLKQQLQQQLVHKKESESIPPRPLSARGSSTITTKLSRESEKNLRTGKRLSLYQVSFFCCSLPFFFLQSPFLS